ncbi:MAG: response regulator [Planctomycetota bacterium]
MTNDHFNSPQHHSGGTPLGRKMPRVLLIEDDDVMREMLAEALRRAGCEVTECGDGLQCLQACGHDTASCQPAEHGVCDTYEVLVSDIRMPNMSGLDVLRTLREILGAEGCPPAVLITAFGDEATHERAQELGAVTVLDKPFAVKELIETVRTVTGM